jgi:protein-disulfide isomerase
MQAHSGHPPFWSSLRIGLDILLSVALLAGTLVITWNGLHQSPAPPMGRGVSVPTVLLSLRRTAVLGMPAARVALLAFSDFECPYCASFATQVLPHLRSKYIDKGLVQLAFRHLPLPAHSHAVPAAAAAECAGRQGKFWEMHDRLFANQARLGTANLTQYAMEEALNLQQFSACVSSAMVADEIVKDRNLALRLGVSSTPTFFLGTVQEGGLRTSDVILGARPAADFESAIERLLTGH